MGTTSGGRNRKVTSKSLALAPKNSPHLARSPTPRRRATGSQGAWILEDAIFGIAQTRDEEHDFPPGQWEVVVTVTNTAGEGPVSNTVTVVVA